MPNQNEIREKITHTIIEALEKGGLAPWRQPWLNDQNAGFPTNVVSKKQYRGINPLLLQIAGMRHGFQSKYWATFKQWQELDGQVMRRPNNVPPGEWGTTIVFWKPIQVTEEDEDTDYLRGAFLKAFAQAAVPVAIRALSVASIELPVIVNVFKP